MPAILARKARRATPARKAFKGPAGTSSDLTSLQAGIAALEGQIAPLPPPLVERLAIFSEARFLPSSLDAHDLAGATLGTFSQADYVNLLAVGGGKVWGVLSFRHDQDVSAAGSNTQRRIWISIVRAGTLAIDTTTGAVTTVGPGGIVATGKLK